MLRALSSVAGLRKPDLSSCIASHTRPATSRGAGLVAQALAGHAGQVVHETVKANLLHDAAHHLVVVELGSGGDLLSFSNFSKELPQNELSENSQLGARRKPRRSSHHNHVVLGRSLAGHLALGVHL